MDNIIVPLLIVVAILVVGLQAMLLRRIIMRLDRSRLHSDALVQSLQTDLRALCTASSGISEHVARLDQQLRRIAQRQDQLDLRDPISQSYGYAIKMVRQGATLDELVERCGLVRDEAELLIRLHRQNKTQIAAA